MWSGTGGCQTDRRTGKICIKTKKSSSSISWPSAQGPALWVQCVFPSMHSKNQKAKKLQGRETGTDAISLVAKFRQRFLTLLQGWLKWHGGWKRCLRSAAEGKRNLKSCRINFLPCSAARASGLFTCFLVSHVQLLDTYFRVCPTQPDVGTNEKPVFWRVLVHTAQSPSTDAALHVFL